ncbi:MAG: aminoglycoside phosphotransferase family protein [Bacilli bacterium]|nr:aminoglycoside phosphotransferase family protein [Bacilli bacterium]
MEEKIKKILKKSNEIIDIKKLGNSYSSNVYLITLKNNKYIFKILKLDEKRKVEASALRYLSKNLNVPKLIKTGIYEGIYYNIMEFIDGISYEDNDSKNIKESDLIRIGEMLSNFHSLRTINDSDMWYEYLYERIENAHIKLQNYLNNNEVIYIDLLRELNEQIKNNYPLTLLHMDFRPGNIIINDKLYLIDFESVKNGDPVFDFIKIKRLLTKKQFNKILEGYKKNRELPNDFENKVRFYNLFDSYTALDWCISNNQIDTDYYKLNMKEIKKYEKRKFQ